ncbi:hypothetical protein F5I97DRAFT_1926676 [Phlebopus sp. FC_14]|nr:hypothetical protein F5I97DRAFT_1926676 [Phlebopus sp. FC_14]
MSSKPTSNPIFVFGAKSGPTTTRAGENLPAKPIPFSFSTNLPSKAKEPVKTSTNVPKQPRRSTTPADECETPPPPEKEQPEEAPLYDLKTVQAAKLEHLKGRKADLSKDHEMRTAPLITREAYIAGAFNKRSTQYGVIGETLAIHSKSSAHVPIDPRLYVNTNAPFSAVVCGVQGSGKSHTVSVLLENMFIPELDSIGALTKPLAGLVLHFGEGGPSARPAEAAWVGVPSASHPKVKTPAVCIFVSWSSLKHTMHAVYEPLGKRVKVMPLVFSESELDAQAFLSMMAVGSSESAPLYIQIVLSILRELGESFSYRRFMRRLEEKNFNPAQTAGLEQRLSLLQSFMEPVQPSNSGGTRTQHGGRATDRSARFAAGQITIMDLSDPFMDPSSACGLFEIVTRLFVRAEVGTGKVLVVDEAHKVGCLRLRLGAECTLSLDEPRRGRVDEGAVTLTREQRHLAMRTIISTQDRPLKHAPPTHVARHVSADVSLNEGFDRVVKLQTGEAIVLAPSGLGVFPDDDDDGGESERLSSTTTATATTTASSPPAAKETQKSKTKTTPRTPLKLHQFGRRFLLMKARARVTTDGGASVLVVEGGSVSGEECEEESGENS